MLVDDIPESDKTVVYWKNISPEKTIDILHTRSWIHCGGALRDTVEIDDMHNVCRLCHIGTDSSFNYRKDRGRVVGSLPTHNGNSHF